MTPQLVDLNADGHNDMIMATFEGMVSLVAGSEDGWQQPVHIVDKNDSNIRIAMYWDEEEMNYLNVDRSTSDYENVEQHHLTSVAAVDWDADGDYDLLLGDKTGALYLCLNEGSAAEPAFAESNLQVKVGDRPVNLMSGLATPRVVDWNGDGLFDILCGGWYGGVELLLNVGEEGEPKFDEVISLVSASIAVEVRSDGIVSENETGLPKGPMRAFHIETCDYDRDGDLDLLVGGIAYQKPKPRKLTEEEKEQLAELKEKHTAIQEEMNQAMEEVDLSDQEAVEKLYHSEEFLQKGQEMSELMEEIDEFEPGEKEVHLIWLYRNKANATVRRESRN